MERITIRGSLRSVVLGYGRVDSGMEKGRRGCFGWVGDGLQIEQRVTRDRRRGR